MKRKKKVVPLLMEGLILFITIAILLPVFYFVISAFKSREDILFYPLKMTVEMFTFDNFIIAFSKMKYFA